LLRGLNYKNTVVKINYYFWYSKWNSMVG